MSTTCSKTTLSQWNAGAISNKDARKACCNGACAKLPDDMGKPVTFSQCVKAKSDDGKCASNYYAVQGSCCAQVSGLTPGQSAESVIAYDTCNVNGIPFGQNEKEWSITCSPPGDGSPRQWCEDQCNAACYKCGTEGICSPHPASFCNQNPNDTQIFSDANACEDACQPASVPGPFHIYHPWEMM